MRRLSLVGGLCANLTTGHTVNKQTEIPMIDDKLISFISRIDRLEEEERKLANDKWCVYAEAFMAGFNMNALEQLIADRKARKVRGLGRALVCAAIASCSGTT